MRYFLLVAILLGPFNAFAGNWKIDKTTALGKDRYSASIESNNKTKSVDNKDVTTTLVVRCPLGVPEVAYFPKTNIRVSSYTSGDLKLPLFESYVRFDDGQPGIQDMDRAYGEPAVKFMWGPMLLPKMKAGKTMYIGFETPNGGTQVAVFSLAGSTKAINKVMSTCKQ